MYKKIIVLLFCYFSTLGVIAQQIRLSGIVSTPDGKPISNVAISENIDFNGKFTNEAGKYILSLPKGRNVKIIFNCIGFKRLEQTVNYNKNATLNITLQYDDKTLRSVNIQGHKRQTDTKQQLDNIRSRTRFMPQGSSGVVETLISTFGGVSRTNELSSQYSVRGGNFDENSIFVNGMEIYRPLLIRSGQQEGLSFINPDMVQSINFSSGGFGAEYGDKMSSVLDIIYKQPSNFEASFNTSLLGADAYVGSSTGRFTQMTSIRYKSNESMLKTTDTKAEYNPKFVDVQSYMTFAVTDRWKIAFLGNVSDNKYRFTPQTRETRFGTLQDAHNFKVYFDGHEKDKFLTSQGAISLKGTVDDKMVLGFMGSAFSSHEYERYDIRGDYFLTEGFNEGKVNNVVNDGLLGIGKYHEHARNRLDAEIYTTSHFGSIRLSNNQLKWAISYQKDHITDKIKEWAIRDSAGYILPDRKQNGDLFSNLKADNELSSSRISGYVQDRQSFDTHMGLFTLDAGIRVSCWDYNKKFLVSPRASVAFIPKNADRFTIRFASGIYYQAPFYKEMQRIVSNGGNNTIEMNHNIKAPKSVHFVFGGDFYFKADDRPFKLSAETYYKKLSDLIPYTVNNVKIRYVGDNLAKGYSMGVDFKLYGEFVEGVDSWISFSLMKTEQNRDGIKSPFPTDQRYNFSIYFQDYMPGYERLKLTLIGAFSQSLPISPPYKGLDKSYFRPPAYKRADIGISWLLLGENFEIRKRSNIFGSFKNIWLGADLLNMFDINNVSTYYWINDVKNQQYAVPNYLTGRQLNIKLRAEF